MNLKINQVNLTYAQTQGTADSPSQDPNGAAIVFTLSNLFGDEQANAQELTLNISYQEYLDNFDDDSAQLTLVKTKMVDKLDTDLVIRVEGINNHYDANNTINSKNIRFNTYDSVNKDNKLVIKDSLDLMIDEYNAAKANKMEGIIEVVKNKLVAEFN